MQKQRRSGERSSQAACFHEAWELLFFCAAKPDLPTACQDFTIVAAALPRTADHPDLLSRHPNAKMKFEVYLRVHGCVWIYPWSQFKSEYFRGVI